MGGDEAIVSGLFLASGDGGRAVDWAAAFGAVGGRGQMLGPKVVGALRAKLFPKAIAAFPRVKKFDQDRAGQNKR